MWFYFSYCAIPTVPATDFDDIILMWNRNSCAEIPGPSPALYFCNVSSACILQVNQSGFLPANHPAADDICSGSFFAWFPLTCVVAFLERVPAWFCFLQQVFAEPALLTWSELDCPRACTTCLWAFALPLLCPANSKWLKETFTLARAVFPWLLSGVQTGSSSGPLAF